MMRSGKPVVPVFYGAEPVDLRWVENGPFAEAFEKHQSSGRTEKKLQEWRDALAALAALAGFRLADYKCDEAQLKREVVNEVARLTPSTQPVEVEQYRVGLEGPANRCIQILDNMGAGIGLLGLVGMGGVGKTTLAREVYNHFAAEKKFKHMTFLEIRRDSSTSDMQVRPPWTLELRKQLLWDLLRVQDSTSNYSSWFQKVSTLGPVLIAVDDVHKLEQFEALIPNASVLHPGSRIIVTSRDRSILNSVAGRSGMDHYLYDVSTLGSRESSMLFNWHAFNSDKAPKEFEDLATDVVKACDGLPLALKVIGSSVFDKRLDKDRESIWPEAVHALRQSSDVMDVLRWSYDSLSESEKFMFLDITCLFYDKCEEDALAYWRSCEKCTWCASSRTPYTSLRNLVNKNLVRLGSFSAMFRVHDLLVDLGQEIGKSAQTHFVQVEDAEAAVLKKQGSINTLGLNLAGSRKRKFDAEDFANMPNLHFLVLPDGCIITGDLKCMSRELRWLRWRRLSLKCVPMDLDVSNLTLLDFSESSNLASLWTESNGNLEGCSNLLQLNLTRCISITNLPDSIKQSSRLQYLYLEGCRNLKLLPQSIGQLHALKYLELGGCTSLKALPDSIGQASRLQSLNLNGCSELRKLPESIGYLQALENLRVTACTSLIALPDTIGSLSNLQHFSAYGCTSLVQLPLSLGLCSSLRSLWLEPSAKCLTFSNANTGVAWSRLVSLHLYNCGGLGSLLNYGALKSLQQLYLHDSTLTELPESIGLLIHLRGLIIHCEQLQYIQNSIGDLKMLDFLLLSRCDNLKKLPKTLGALTRLKCLYVWCCLITKLPRSVGQLSALQRLELKGCTNLQKLPTSIKKLKGLQQFTIQDCGSIDAMGGLTTLQGLPIWGSTSVTKLPASLGFVSTLVVSGDNLESYEHEYTRIVGTSQVLEEDESGFLKAYHDESSGVTSLLRGRHKEATSYDIQ